MIIIYNTVQMEAIGKNKCRLLADFKCEIDGVKYVIPKGFEWDGASLPKAAWTLHGHPYDDKHLEPGLWHDAAYRGLFKRLGVDKAYADGVYFSWLRVNKMLWIQAAVEWAAVSWFGGKYWKGGNDNLTRIEKAAIVVGTIIALSLGFSGCQTIGKAVEAVPASWWEKALEGIVTLLAVIPGADL